MPRLSRLHALRLGFGAMTALLVFSAVQAFRIQTEASHDTAEIYHRYVRKGEALAQVRRLLYLSSIYTRDLFLRPEPDRISIYQGQIARLQAEAETAINELELLTDSDASISGLKTHTDGLWAKLGAVPSWADKADARRGFDFVMREVVPRRNAAGALLSAYGEANQRALEASEAELRGSRRTAANRLLFMLGITIALGVTVSSLSIAHGSNLERRSELHLQQVIRARQELQRLSSRLLEIQEDERRRLSRELHDEIGQTLHALRIEISQARTLLPSDTGASVARLDHAHGLAEHVVASIRDISLLLRPSLLDDLGLGPALQWLSEDFSRRSGIRCILSEDGIPDELPDTIKTCVYRVVQEALHNCEKHSGASSVRITVRRTVGQLVIDIEDDGRGFEPGTEATPTGMGGLGLLGMRERAAMVGGSFALDAAPGGGARLTLSVPLPDPVAKSGPERKEVHA